MQSAVARQRMGSQKKPPSSVIPEGGLVYQVLGHVAMFQANDF